MDKIYKMYKILLQYYQLSKSVVQTALAIKVTEITEFLVLRFFKTFHFLYDLTDLDDEFQASDGSSFIV